MKNYFKLDDFFHSRTALDNNITNIPNEPDTMLNIARLWHFLNVVRDELGCPIYINSAFRTKELNEQVQGSKNSFHMKGRAADIRTNPEKMDLLYSILHTYSLTELIKYDTFIHIAI